MRNSKNYRLVEYISHIENDRTLSESLKEELLKNSETCEIYSNVDEMFNALNNDED